MVNREVPFLENEYFHVYNRGNSKQSIFFDQSDYQRMQALLYLSNCNENFVYRDVNKTDLFNLPCSSRLIDIEAYCLMPNHFHLLMKSRVDNGISIFMKKMATAYSMYFNKKYHRTGGLFEGRFKAEHIDNDIYLKYLFSYIHLNPVKLVQPSWKELGIKDMDYIINYLNSYNYSSYIDFYIGPTYVKRESESVLSKNLFDELFPDKDLKMVELLEWLTYNDLG